MNRRALLTRTTGFAPATAPAPAKTRVAAPATTGPGDPPETISPFANKKLPGRGANATAATLTPYAGPWGAAQAAHLLRRCRPGAPRAEVQAAAASSLAAVLDQLLTTPAAPAPPLNVSTTDTSVPQGQTWVREAFNQDIDYVRRVSLRAWWVGQQLSTDGRSMVEALTLFWHNHFVVDISDLNDARYGYEYVRLLRLHALGNVRQLAQEITVAPAMLRYLNGEQSTAGAPNENFGRELLELFTLGKGPLVGPGNYTTYTEADVQAAARVLTGWRADPVARAGYFTATRHDNTSKQFSAAFGNAVIAPGGATEYQALINLVFGRAETARYLVRKLYRWFVYYVIDAQIEADIIRPLATLLGQSNYDVVPVLRKLFASEHFFDVSTVGSRIKSPLDFTLGTARHLEMALPPATTLPAQYAAWDYLWGLAALQQQALGEPPNVAGWAAYDQSPQYHELWVNAVTLPRRNQTTDLVISANGFTRTGATSRTDPAALVLALPAATASDANLLVQHFVRLLLPLELTAGQLTFLKNALIPGLPDFEWTVEWLSFTADQANAAKRKGVTDKLRALLRTLMGLAEYHLS